MKVLLSAHACEPNCGSEEDLGWQAAQEIAKYAKVWVITRPKHRDAIEMELLRNPIPSLHFIYFEAFPFTLIDPWCLGHLTGQLHYYLWQVHAYFVVRKFHHQLHFDIAQHITYAKYWSPSFLALLPLPLVWGPVGGGEAAPKAFWRDFSLRGKIYELLRETAQRICELDPFTRLTAQRSRLVLATTQDTAQRVIGMGASNVKVFTSVGLSGKDIEQLANLELPTSNKVRFISIGRFLHWKGYHLSIRAFHQAKLTDAEYWLVGDGAERIRLERLIKELDLEQTVKLWGTLSRDKTLNRLGECHILVHPSLHESGGWVCAEGMAAGRPIICLDLGGPAIQVTQETGIKIPAQNPAQVIQDLTNAMTQLAHGAELRTRMGIAGRKRVREQLSWESKGYLFTKNYEEIINAK